MMKKGILYTLGGIGIAFVALLVFATIVGNNQVEEGLSKMNERINRDAPIHLSEHSTILGSQLDGKQLTIKGRINAPASQATAKNISDLERGTTRGLCTSAGDKLQTIDMGGGEIRIAYYGVNGQHITTFTVNPDQCEE